MPERYDVERDVSQPRRRSSQSAPNTEQPREEPRIRRRSNKGVWIFFWFAIFLILFGACWFGGVFDLLLHPLNYGNDCNYNSPYGCAGLPPTLVQSSAQVHLAKPTSASSGSCPAPSFSYVEKNVPQGSALEVQVADPAQKKDSASLIGLFKDKETGRCWLRDHPDKMPPKNPGPAFLILVETNNPGINPETGNKYPDGRPAGSWAIISTKGQVSVNVVSNVQAAADEVNSTFYTENYSQTTRQDSSLR